MSKYKKIISILCTATLFFSFASIFVSADEPVTAISSQAKTVSVKFKDVDVRDALSALALNMGYNVIYTSQPMDVNIEMKNVTPTAAFEYVLNMTGLSYFRDGSSLVVGEKDALLEDFARTLSLTKFDLAYVSPTTITQKIQELSIDVKTIVMPANNKTVWVQGFPQQIAKVSELIRILDIDANADAGSAGTADTGKYFTLLEFEHISASGFNNLLRAIGYTNGVTVAENDKLLWIFATPAERSEILAIRTKIERENPRIELGGLETSFFTYNFTRITAAEAERRLKNIKYAEDVNLYVTTHGEYSKTLFVYCNKSYREQVTKLLASLDVEIGTAYNLPVFRADNLAGATAMKDYLETMIGTSPMGGSFVIQTFNGVSVLYLTGTDAETVNVVEQLVKRYLNLASEEVKAADLTWAAFEAATNSGNPLEQNDTNKAKYATWVLKQIG